MHVPVKPSVEHVWESLVTLTPDGTVEREAVKHRAVTVAARGAVLVEPAAAPMPTPTRRAPRAMTQPRRYQCPRPTGGGI